MTHGIINDDRILKRLFLQLMAINILIGLIQPANQLIDSVLTGNGLGIEALEAYALFLPAAALFTAISCVFSVGTQITCSHMLGSGRFEASEALTRTAFVSAAVFSLAAAGALLAFPERIAALLGASAENPRQAEETAAYLRGYAPGIPAVFLTGIMMSLLQLEGRKKLVVILSFCNLAVNAAGDFANLWFFRKGLFGMALSSAVSYWAVFAALIFHFLFRSNMFRFSLSGFSAEKLLMILKNGVPSLTYYGSLVLRAAFFNWLIISGLGGNMLAVMLVISSFTTLVDAAIGGTGDAELLLSGVLYGEKDIKGMRVLLKTAMLSGALLLLAVSLVSVLASEPLAALFSDNRESGFISAAARAIRLTALCFVPDAVACVLKKHIQAVGRARYTSLTNVLCNVLYVCPAAYVLSAFTGADGIFLSLLVCYTAVLFTHLVYARHISRKNGRHGFDILLFLPDNFELSRDDIWECSVLDQPGCIEASERVYAYCLEKNVDKRRSFHISLFVEEMTKNIVTYGFADGKKHVIVVKLIIAENGVLLSIKDNCRRFDPKHYYDSLKTKEDKAKGIGIRMVMPLSKSVSYTNSFSLNNLRVEL